YVFFFFFFQAEDGIRDYKVTGVQTCALPILIAADEGIMPQTEEHLAIVELLGVRHDALVSRDHEQGDVDAGRAGQHVAHEPFMRSEERRVGKEWRSGRWTSR